MGLVRFALRRPFTIMVAMAAIVLGSALAVWRMPKDIFPSLDLPVIYVCQPYGGMDPAQMEGLITNYYEYHFLYISGIDHVESRNVQGMALMKLVFHPGTNMAQAMAETIAYVNRSRAFMPPGTVSPFVMRFDTGSVPVGFLVLQSATRSLGEIQDLALFHVRPMFSTLPGVSAPPPFGASVRSIVFRIDPDRLRSYHVSPDDIITALTAGNTISPSGNMQIGDRYPIVPLNALVRNLNDLGNIPVRTGSGGTVYLRDIGGAEDSTDIPVGYSLVNGRRAIYILATKRAEASTLSVVNNIKTALPRMKEKLPDDIDVSFEMDQSTYVTRAIWDLVIEGLLGALLTGVMVLLFLRDWRSALVVVLNIPLAVLAALIGLWLGGHTINLMTLSGLALAVGILVDEATVEVENIHTQLVRTHSIAWAVRLGNMQTAIPRLLAMLCMLAVFVPAVFMEGAARALFVPLSLAVGFAMIASYLLSSTFVPVLSVWLLRHQGEPTAEVGGWFSLARWQTFHGRLLEKIVGWRWPVALVYLALVGLGGAALYERGARVGMDIFPQTDTGQFRLRLRAADGTHFNKTEALALAVLRITEEEVGKDKIDLTLGYVGMIPASFPINAVYQWSRGPEEAILRVALKRGSGIAIGPLKERLRQRLAQELPNVRFSFEPADIVSEVMSFGSPTPIEIAVSGPVLADSRAFATRLRDELAKIDSLRDLQLSQSLDYPTIDVDLDRVKAGKSGVQAGDVARSLVAATSSSRFVVPVFWPDPKTGIGYQVQVEVPRARMNSIDALEQIPVKRSGDDQILLRDLATVVPGKMPGQYDRYNQKREITVTANIEGADLGTVARQVEQAIRGAGAVPKGATVTVRGQLPPMNEMLTGLGTGLGLAVVAIFLLLAANFQSLRLPLVVVSAVPAVVAGVLLMLLATRTTLNIQSFIGAIMAIGVAMANAILLITFAEHERRAGKPAAAAAITGATSRLRPILMTSAAMMSGMLPMALGLGESGAQSAPLGRAVIGGLAAATLATLLLLPALFAVVQARATTRSASLDPEDPLSPQFGPRPEGD